MKNRKTERAPRLPEWAVAVRLADGTIQYYVGPKRAAQEWGPRASQAERFESERDAAAFANACQTNGAAKEYTVVNLGQPQNRR